MKTLYTRKKKTIKNIETGKIEKFMSHNEAKRKSRFIQMQNGGLGVGSVVVIN